MNYKLKTLAVVCILFLCSIAGIKVNAKNAKAPALMHMRLYSHVMVVDNKSIEMLHDYVEIQPFQQDKKLYVPVKYIASGMNGTFSFSKKTKKTTIKVDGTTFVFQENSKSAVINKKKTTMKGKTISKGGFLFVPASVFMDQLKTTNVTVYQETCIIFRKKGAEDSYTSDHKPIGECVPYGDDWKEALKSSSHGKEAEKKADEILAKIILPGMSDIEKVMAVNDYLVEHTTYTFDERTAYGPLLNGTGVCAGYAHCTELLLNKAGVPCTRVQGYAGFDCENYTNDIVDALGWTNNGHEWNLVKIDGKWYHLDVTWNDKGSNDKESVKYSYNYFLLSDDEMSVDHLWRRAFYEKVSAPFYSQKEAADLQSKGYPVISGTISLSNQSKAPKGGVTVEVSYDTDSISYERTYVIPEGKNEIPFQIVFSKRLADNDLAKDLHIRTKTRGYEEIGEILDASANNYKIQMKQKEVHLLTGKLVLPDGVKFETDYRYWVNLEIYEKIEGQNGLSGCCYQSYDGTAKPGQKELYFDFDATIPTNEYQYRVNYTITIPDYDQKNCPVVDAGYLTEDGTIVKDSAYIKGTVCPLKPLTIQLTKADHSLDKEKDPNVNKPVKVTPTKEVRQQIIKELKKFYVANRSKLSKVTTLAQAEKLYSGKPDETSEARNGDKSIYYYDKLSNGIKIRVVYSDYANRDALICSATIENLNLTAKNYMTVLNDINSYVKTAVKAKKQAPLYVVDLNTYNAVELTKKDYAAVYQKVMDETCEVSTSYEFGKEIYQITLRKNGNGELCIDVGKY